MGLGSSKADPNSALVEWYSRLEVKSELKGYNTKGTVIGADEEVYGSAEILSPAKEALIRDIAVTLAEQLKLPGIANPRSQNIDNLVAALKKSVPDPRPGKGNNKSWNNNGTSQDKAVRIMAKAINDRMGQPIVDLSASTHVVAERVAEVFHSLFTGVHAEFLTVASDVKRMLRNLDALSDMARSTYKQLESKLLPRDSDAIIPAETDTLRKFYDSLEKEQARQRKMLQAMLNEIVDPADRELRALYADSEEFRHYIKSTKEIPLGTDKFARGVASLTRIAETVADSAAVVDRALKKLGISMKEYTTTRDVQDIVSKHLEQSMRGASVAELRKLNDAAKAIYNREYRRDEIVQQLTKRGRGEDNVFEGSDEVTGGIKVDKRIKAIDETKRELVNVFNIRMVSLFKKVGEIGRRVTELISAGRIPITTSVENFAKSIESIPDMQRRHVYLALTGFSNDVESKTVREQFLGSLDYAVKMLEAMSRETKDGAFSEMAKVFREMKDTIEDFASRFEKGFELGISPKRSDKHGGGVVDAVQKAVDIGKQGLHAAAQIAKATTEAIESADHLVNPTAPQLGTNVAVKETAVGLTDGRGEIDGADEMEVEGGAVLDNSRFIAPEVSRSAYNLNKFREAVLFNIRTSKIRQNLKKASEEMASYSEDYNKILGDAIAKEVDARIKEMKEEKEKLEGKASTAPFDKATFDTADIDNTDKYEKDLAPVRELLTEMYKAKLGIYKTAEAMDHYMRFFTTGLEKNPDDLKDLMTNLDSLEQVSEWFRNNSGDLIAKVFDTFPGTENYGAADSNTSTRAFSRLDKSDSSKVSSKHYYVRVSALCNLPTGVNGVNTHLNGDFKLNMTTYAAVIVDLKEDEKPQSATHAAPVAPYFTIALPGNPFVPIYVSKTGGTAEDISLRDFLKRLRDALSTSVLKNILAAFVNIGDRFGGKELQKLTNMSPKEIYVNLVNYMIFSSLSLGEGHINHTIDINYDFAIPIQVSDTNGVNRDISHANRSLIRQGGLHYENDPYQLTLPTPLPAAMTANKQLMRNALSRRVASVHMRDTLDPAIKAGAAIAKDFFVEEDRIFVLIIKAMVAKIVTAVGAYNMLNRPVDQHALGYFSGLRLAVGGSDIKIIPEALELYVRLPILAEFYKRIFKLDSNVDNISLIPEFNGMFGGLLEIIFNKAKSVNEGSYSQSDYLAIIEEVNKIYSRYGKKEDCCGEIIREFVAEINRRYGIVKADERTKYKNMREQQYADKYTPDEELVDFELNGIDENDVYFKPAPSLQYQTETDAVIGNLGEKHKHEIKQADFDLVKTLRSEIDKFFSDVAPQFGGKEDLNEVYNAISLTPFIRAYEMELGSAKPEDKLSLVIKAMSSLGAKTINSMENSLLLFHELVVAPLNNLQYTLDIVGDAYGKIKEVYDLFRLINKVPDDGLFLHGNAGIAMGVVIENAIDHDAGCALLNTEAARFIGLLKKYRTGAKNAAFGVNDDLFQTSARNGLGGAVGTEIRVSSVQRMIAGVINNPNLATLIGAKSSEDAKRQIIIRFIIDHEYVLHTLIEALLRIQKKGIIDVNLDVSEDKDGICDINVNVSCGGFIQKTRKAIEGIKANINSFRGIIPKSILDRFELLKQNNVETPGTIYYLERGLLDELIDAKWSTERKNTQNMTDKDCLGTMAEYVKYALDIMSRKWNVTGFGTARAAITVDNFKDPTKYNRANVLRDGGDVYAIRQSFDLLFHMLTDYDMSADAMSMFSALHFPARPPHVGLGLTKLLINNDQTKHGTALGAAWPGTATNIGNFVDYLNPDMLETVGNSVDAVASAEVGRLAAAAPGAAGGAAAAATLAYQNFSIPAKNGSGFKSIFISFNRLIAAYLAITYDDSYRKIYEPTISALVNGPLNSAIFGVDSFDDGAVIPLGHRVLTGSTSSVKILIKSLADIIKQLYTEKIAKGDTKYYATTNVSDLPVFMIERYRNHLPMLKQAFEAMIERCSLISKLVKALNVATSDDGAGAANNVCYATNATPAPGIVNGAALAWGNHVSDKEMKNYFLGVYAKVIESCHTIIKSIETTLSDVGSIKDFGITRDSFVSEYESVNGKKPLALFSNAVYGLTFTKGNVAVAPAITRFTHIIEPDSRYGSNKFELTYGMATIYKPNSAAVKTLSYLIQGHNRSAGERFQLNESNILEQFAEHADILEHNILAGYVKKFFSQPRKGDAVNYGYAVQENTADYVHVVANPIVYGDVPVKIYQLRSRNPIQPADIVDLVNNSDQRAVKNKIVNTVEAVNVCKRGGRATIIAANIIDLNIVPINIHALMREIPLINLYNASYTFDKMICDTLGTNVGAYAAPVFDATDPGKHSPREVLSYMTIDPYINMDMKIYGNQFARIMRGEIGVEGLGRPKFLADEVYNKPLFGEAYSNDIFFDDAGPSYGTGLERGYNSDPIYEKVMNELVPRIVTALKNAGRTFPGAPDINIGFHGDWAVLTNADPLPAPPQVTDGPGDFASLFSNGTARGARLVGAPAANANRVNNAANIYDNINAHPDAADIKRAIGAVDIRRNAVALVALRAAAGGGAINIRTDTVGNFSQDVLAVADNISSTEVINRELTAAIMRPWTAAKNAVNNSWIQSPKAASEDDVAEAIRTCLKYLKYSNIASIGDIDSRVKEHLLQILMSVMFGYDLIIPFGTKIVNLGTSGVTIANSPSIYKVGAYRNADDLIYAYNICPFEPTYPIDAFAVNIAGTIAAARVTIANTVPSLAAIRARVPELTAALLRPVGAASTAKIETFYRMAGLIIKMVLECHIPIYHSLAKKTASGSAINLPKIIDNINFIPRSVDRKFVCGPRGDINNGHITGLAGAALEPLKLLTTEAAAAGLIAAVGYADANGIIQFVGNAVAANLSLVAVAASPPTYQHLPGTPLTADEKKTISKMLESVRFGDTTSLAPNREEEGLLHYLEKGKDGFSGELKRVHVGKFKRLLQVYGWLRFNTKFMRNIIWLSNIQRILRAKLRRELTWYDSTIIDSHALLASGMTELYGNDVSNRDSKNTYRY